MELLLFEFQVFVLVLVSKHYLVEFIRLVVVK